jgi:hypothetical protein
LSVVECLRPKVGKALVVESALKVFKADSITSAFSALNYKVFKAEGACS